MTPPTLSFFTKYLKVVLAVIVVYQLYIFAGFIYEDYNVALKTILAKMYCWEYDTLKTDATTGRVYGIFRKLIPALIIFFTLTTILFIIRGTTIFFYKEDKWLKGGEDIIRGNKQYISSLPINAKAVLLTLLMAQGIGFLYFVLNAPYHYDEAWSYTFFSSKGMLAGLTFYPVPNNHVLLNVLTPFFLKYDFDIITALRLPSYLISFFSVYYFFKLSHIHFNWKTAVVLTVVFTFLNTFVYYSFQSRGYALLLFFAIACYYCAASVIAGGSYKKYMTIYAFCAVMGFFAIPSFLYFYVPVTLFLAVYVLLKKREAFLYGVLTTLATIAGTILVYLPIALMNSVKALTDNNGVVKRDFTYIKENIFSHLEATWGFLTYGLHLPVFAGGIFLAFTVAGIFKGGRPFLAMLCVLLLVAPFPIILLHKVIPFERTWIFLMVPVVLSIGFTIDVISNLIKLRPTTGINTQRAGLVAVLLVCATAAYAWLMLGEAKKAHYAGNKIDYVVRDYATSLKDKITAIDSIATSGDGLTFYLADDLQFEKVVATRKGGPGIYPVADTAAPAGEIFIVSKENKRLIPSNYLLVENENDFFRLYIRNDQ